MKTLFLDCGMGAAGDMLTAALLELFPNPDGIVAELNALGIPKVAFRRERAVKCGIAGTHVVVTVDGEEEGEEAHAHEHEHEHVHEHEHGHAHVHEHHEHDHDDEKYGRARAHAHEHGHSHSHSHPHGHLSDIKHVVNGHLTLPEAVRKDILAVYQLIADAESHVHGVPVSDIHFHEVGTMDALADITAVCLLMHRLAPEQVVASPIHVGSGHVQCAHGILPVPAPATAHILRGLPIYGGAIDGELCTPTGAALLKHFVDRFGPMPAMRVKAIGYGMGRKDFPAANCLRAMVGEADGGTEGVVELSCNVDDMTGEEIGYAMERLFAAGALEVYTIPIGMKKCRPGTLIRVMCAPSEKERLLEVLFACTSTIGVRESTLRRHVLKREVSTVKTPLGDVRRKVSTGFGVRRVKYEYDDLARVAREKGLSLDEARRRLEEQA